MRPASSLLGAVCPSLLFSHSLGIYWPVLWGRQVIKYSSEAGLQWTESPGSNGDPEKHRTLANS